MQERKKILPNEACSGAGENDEFILMKLSPHGILASIPAPRMRVKVSCVHCSRMHVIIYAKTKLEWGGAGT